MFISSEILGSLPNLSEFLLSDCDEIRLNNPNVNPNANPNSNSNPNPDPNVKPDVQY